jgi:LPXTG-motif cell wall-anchored protein
MIRRATVLIATAVAALVVGSAAPASAVTYPGGGGTVTVSAGVIAPGGTVTAQACGFEPGTDVETSVETSRGVREAGTVQAGDDGCATATFTITASGEATLFFTGMGADGSFITESTTITVRAGGAGSGDGNGGGGDDGAGAGSGGLPQTGGSLTPLWAGLALLVAGGALVLSTRSRRSRVLI